MLLKSNNKKEKLNNYNNLLKFFKELENISLFLDKRGNELLNMKNNIKINLEDKINIEKEIIFIKNQLLKIDNIVKLKNEEILKLNLKNILKDLKKLFILN